ncbi:hypothetical protein BN59_03324 [Legionella massiliensis]|uniref:Uncharacterized protein n=1 Tax=Legionella massiliensis TaxID=1034943 RepID=A0A078L4L3_9GAMM|nr:DUF5630 domain-containing protein [Legionella massiliensis]CDZ79009.1 hypothetical protein BN59_03324 [Legionella massiliensis]CEE14747.1 hypothetical protein BN1094_03324 [Legionella massiliensis]
MTLAEFLILNVEEKNFHGQLIKLSQNKNAVEHLERLIQRSDTGMLLKLALTDPEIDAICKLPQFEDYWTDIWRQTGVNPREMAQDSGEPIHENLPMPTVSSFELLKGLFLYEEYRRQLEAQTELTEKFFKEAEEFLVASVRHGCYFAMNALCMAGLELLQANFDADIAIKVLICARVAANFYLSPGYLLLSNVYHDFIQYKDKDCFAGLNLRIEAFKAAYMAERLEEYSIAMINNAYQGKTLQEASGGKIKGFSHAKTRLQNYLALNAFELNQAIGAVGREVGSIIAQVTIVADSAEPQDDGIAYPRASG